MDSTNRREIREILSRTHGRHAGWDYRVTTKSHSAHIHYSIGVDGSESAVTAKQVDNASSAAWNALKEAGYTVECFTSGDDGHELVVTKHDMWSLVRGAINVEYVLLMILAALAVLMGVSILNLSASNKLAQVAEGLSSIAFASEHPAAQPSVAGAEVSTAINGDGTVSITTSATGQPPYTLVKDGVSIETSVAPSFVVQLRSGTYAIVDNGGVTQVAVIDAGVEDADLTITQVGIQQYLVGTAGLGKPVYDLYRDGSKLMSDPTPQFGQLLAGGTYQYQIKDQTPSKTKTKSLTVPSIGITIDGDMSDWSPLLADHTFGHVDDPTLAGGDADAPTAYRDIVVGSAYWDANNLYLYIERADEIAANSQWVAYLDVTGDGRLSTSDYAMVVTESGTSISNIRLYRYSPLATTDDMGGSGMPVVGALGVQTASVTGVGTAASTMQGAVSTTAHNKTEYRIKWSTLGVPQGTKTTLKFSSVNSGSGVVTDNTDTFITGNVLP